MSNTMNTTAPEPTRGSRRGRVVALVLAAAAITAVTTSPLVDTRQERVATNGPAQGAAPSLSPSAGLYVAGIEDLTRTQLVAGHGTVPVAPVPATTRDFSMTDAVLTELGQPQRRHIAGLPTSPLCTKTLIARSARAIWVVPCRQEPGVGRR